MPENFNHFWERISQSNEHSHELNAGRSEARQLVQQMKETVRSQLNPVNSQIIAASLQLVQDEKATQLSLPSRSALTRTLNRSKQTTSLPTIATDDRHFEISDRFKQFCLFDSGKQDTERILIFGDLENLNALKLYNKTWLVDGTFKYCLSQFYQLYTVHIQIGGFYPPCVYALLSNKRLSTYNKFLTALKSLIGDVTPERILIDFEIAALSAFTSHYETDIKGCYFHLCQSFMRKISELGLKKTYESNSELVLALNMIPALSFVPESKVEIGFDLVIEEICSVATKLDISQNNLEKLDELTAYFQKTYIRGDLIGRKTLFLFLFGTLSKFCVWSSPNHKCSWRVASRCNRFVSRQPSFNTYVSRKNSTGLLQSKVQHFEGIQRHYQLIPEEVPWSEWKSSTDNKFIHRL